MRPLHLCALMCLLSGCAHAPAPVPSAPSSSSRSSSAPGGIPCPADPPIVAHGPKGGAQDDRANAYDTPETVAAIERHNAARKAVCP